MSYILDALRRADAERQQGGVPGLHTPPSPQAEAPVVQRPWLPWAAAALLLVVVGVLAWWWTRPAVVTVVVAPAVAPTLAPAMTRPPAPALPPPAAAPLPIVVSAAPVAAAAPAAPASAAPAPTPTPAPASPAPRTVSLQQLDGDLRRQLPPLVVGGSVWSDSAASRFVILDGQVTREGESVAPGLVLDRIQPKSVLLRWRDMRLEISL